MKKAAVVLILLLVAPIVCLAGSGQGEAAADPALDPPIEKGFWQYGIESGQDSVRLTLRDKLGRVGDYRAVFAVTAPDRREYGSEKSGSGTGEIVASFPNDFGATWMKGVYAWSCSIGGSTIAQGTFQYCTSCQIRLLRTGFPPVRSAGR